MPANVERGVDLNELLIENRQNVGMATTNLVLSARSQRAHAPNALA